MKDKMKEFAEYWRRVMLRKISIPVWAVAAIVIVSYLFPSPF